MKTVLSIDFDIIMAPTIQNYDHLVPKMSWEKMAQEQPLSALAYPDYRHYHHLFNYIMSIAKKVGKEDIYIIEDHGKLVDFLPRNEYIDLINIDHHHDIFYPNNPEQEITCANWVKNIADYGILKSYTWIRNTNSEEIDVNYKKYINHEYDFQEVFYEKKITLAEPDMIFLCLSEPWIPIRVRPLFYLILDNLNSYYNTHFTIHYGKSESGDFKCKLKN